jgi:hypothetical protein
MSDAERFLEPDCDELPVCRCGKEMYVALTRSSPKMPDVDIRVYNCVACDHEMHLAIWRADPAAAPTLELRTLMGSRGLILPASWPSSKSGEIFILEGARLALLP